MLMKAVIIKYNNVTFNQGVQLLQSARTVFSKPPNCIQDVVSSVYYARGGFENTVRADCSIGSLVKGYVIVFFYNRLHQH